MEYRKLIICVIFGTLFNIVMCNVLVVLTAEEEISGRHFLGNIADKVNDSENLDLENAEYEILTSTEYSSFFSIESNSDFYLNTRLDREDICLRAAICEIRVEIAATIGTNLEIINVKIQITDINDNQPTFTRSVFSLSISEGTPLMTSYELPSASDLDTGKNSIQSYTLEPNNTSFNLEVHQNLDGTSALNLVLNLSLDRETIDWYQLSIRAIDGGTPKLTGLLTVFVNVTDINDNRPVFNPQEYNTTINEDIEVGTGIVNVTATDRDIGDNARLAYSFTGMDPATISNAIGINEETGEIYVKESFDSATGPFTLYVEARDHGNPVKKSFQGRVVINVRDINDNVPNIRITKLSNGRVFENVEMGTPVAHIKIEDADIGLNGDAACECDNSNFLIHKISTNNFRVDVATQFDREVQDLYHVTINCSDKGEPPLSSAESFNLIIDDINDNKPKFTQPQYSKDIYENNIAGSVFLRVSASDLDLETSGNGQIVYAIVPFEDQSKFIIDQNTGIIKSTVAFDREVKSLYTFTVTASDRGSTPLVDNATIIVTILDENDNAPEFEGDSYAPSVYENSNISTSIGHIIATDADEGNNKKISYMIPAEYSSYPFAILDDGTIITTQVLDRELTSHFQFEVVASDHGNPPKTTSVPVVVTVLDQNDNPPYMEFPDGENNTVSVAHNTMPNKVITTIIASDKDEKDNKKLSYSIVSGNDRGIFQINEYTGDIILQKQIISGDVKLYTLSISVKDQGKTQLETRATLYIKFYVANDTLVTSPLTGSTGQNILIAIIISCVTFVLSVIIITIICIIRRKDRLKSLYSAKAYDEQKIMSSVNRDSSRSTSSKGSKDKMIYPENNYADNAYQLKRNKKEVSFSLEEQDGGISMETNGQFDSVSTFKSPSPVPPQNNVYDPNYHQEMTPPQKPERSDEKKQRDLHRMTSLRVHQALIQSHNNNNNKQWPQSPQEEKGKAYMGLQIKTHLDDSHSETSGETATSDSGRGGSEEDIRNSIMMNSHDTDDSRSPNTSSAHPFYTAESQQPTFSSFHGNSVHRTGPILSSFLNRGQNKGLSDEPFNKNSYPLNDLSNPHRSNNNSQHRHVSENNLTLPPRNLNSASPFPNTFGHGQLKMDSDPLLLNSNPSNLNYRNSFENESITGRSQDDDNTTTTSGSYTINDLTDDILASEVKDMFYKPDTFV